MSEIRRIKTIIKANKLIKEKLKDQNNLNFVFVILRQTVFVTRCYPSDHKPLKIFHEIADDSCPLDSTLLLAPKILLKNSVCKSLYSP
jgi:hypothetical protein